MIKVKNNIIVSWASDPIYILSNCLDDYHILSKFHASGFSTAEIYCIDETVQKLQIEGRYPDDTILIFQ